MLHLRRSKSEKPPRAVYRRYAGAVAIPAVGVFVGLYPFLPVCQWHSFMEEDNIPEDPSQWVLRWVDAVASIGITVVAALAVKVKHAESNYIRHAVWAIVGSWMLVVLLAATMFVAKKYHPILQHASWHLEGVNFMWIAWLMVDRIAALCGGDSFAMSHSGTMIRTATACFHMRIVTETFLGFTDTSLAIQLFFASTFLLLWFFLCLNIAVCLSRYLRIMQKEASARPLHGAKALRLTPLKVEELWAIRVLRCELTACMLITFSTTTLWWMPYKVLGWVMTKSFADATLLIPVVVAHRFNHLIKVTSVASLSGLLWSGTIPKPAPASTHKGLQAKSNSLKLGDVDIWSAKVQELGNRGVTVLSLLGFWRQLMEDKVMPSFDPFRSTTNDVVRQAIIPLTRQGEGGRAMSSIWAKGFDMPAQCMVTHNWSNLFLHLVAAIIADSLGERYYADIAASLAAGGEAMQLLESKLLERPECAGKTYWVCAFAVNQHACICDNFGRPPEGEADFREWDSKRRDTVTGELYAPCTCNEPRFYNHDEPALCEMNKFDAMMRHLNRTLRGFSHLVVADTNFEVFTRAWCIAEVVEAGMSDISQRILLHSQETLDCNYQRLSSIDVRHCQATRPEDKAMILSNIEDFDQFNAALQFAIFGTEGLLSKFTDGLGVAQQVGRIVHRVSTYGWHLGSGSSIGRTSTNTSSSDRV
ncbi:Gstt1 [Symbiodinium natans]|uniref:Gstt1 protein n=1 Tax=Symbiodinium natans TaxID=878477 RepID=A0A812IEJ6_9DINO|nr:Gstt1 [Symbiodinium natans]